MVSEQSDLQDKVMVVTGATSGIGLAAASALAGRGAFVIGVGRSPERCAQAREMILSQHPGAQVEYLIADLASQRQVRALAAAIHERISTLSGGRLDVLVNNAAQVVIRYSVTEEGYERQFAVNHLAPFLLTHELLPALRAAPAARVVTVSSDSHRNTRMHWNDIMLRRFYNPLLAYRQSKLANVLFTVELNRRLGEDARLRAYAADPGLVHTGIGSKSMGTLAGLVWRLWSARGAPPEKGAATVIFLAADPSVGASREIYWRDCRPIQPDPYALRADEAVRLWELSARLCGLDRKK